MKCLAYRHLTEAIFGPAHPYGKNVFPEDYLAIRTEDLRSHHRHHIIPQKGMVLVIRFVWGKGNRPHPENHWSVEPKPIQWNPVE